MNINIVGLKV